MTVLGDIRSRGYWHRIVRPIHYAADRIGYSDLESVIRNCSVEFGGSAFPNSLGGPNRKRYDCYIQEDVARENVLETWRLYQSGQFVSDQAYMFDWTERRTFTLGPKVDPGKYLGIMDSICALTEFFEFSSRLATSPAGQRDMWLCIEARGLANRSLASEDPARALYSARTTSAESYVYQKALRSEALVAAPQDMALDVARELFSRFGMRIEKATLRSIQEDLSR